MADNITIFNIVKYVREALLKDEYISDLTKKQVFVVEGKENVKFPFITIVKTSAADQTNKDFIIGTEVSIGIAVLTNDYAQMTDLAEHVYDAMQKYFVCTRTSPVMTDNYEDYDAEKEVYFCVLEYTFRI